MSQGTKESCQCDKCQRACTRRAGWFLPGQAEKAAALMGLTLKEFFDQWLQIDWWIEDEGFTFILIPGLKGQATGEKTGSNPTGECVFYQDGGCAIHPAKPQECAESIHRETNDDVDKRHEAVAADWREPQYQQQIEELLGHPVEGKESSWLDMFW